MTRLISVGFFYSDHFFGNKRKQNQILPLNLSSCILVTLVALKGIDFSKLHYFEHLS